MSDEIYLGDGLFVSFDRDQIKLRSTRGPFDDHVIFLDKQAFHLLEACAKERWADAGMVEGDRAEMKRRKSWFGWGRRTG